MTAKYIIRLDDACAKMDHAKWQRLEAILDARSIKPVVAVVPDNKDPFLEIDKPDDQFWSRVRRWEAKGWTIAMHGYQHLFHTVKRKRLLLPFYDRSEFGELSFDAQSDRIRRSWNLFLNEGIRPTVWIAPAHCFDRTTLLAIQEETTIRIVSDGLACDQFFKYGFHWLPQQLWSLKERSFGLWTLCLHPNQMSFSDLDNLEQQLYSETYRHHIVGISDIGLKNRPKSLLDHAYSTYFWQKGRVINALLNVRNFIKAPSQ